MIRSVQRWLLLGAAFVFPAAPVVAQAALGLYLSPAIRQLTAGISGCPVVAFGPFTYADKKVGSAFSRYLEEGLAAGIARQGRMEVFARGKLEQILSAQEINLSDLVDQTTPASIGKIKGVQALLTGSFFDVGGEVKVYLQLLSLESATALGRAELALPKRAIPPMISILPDNYNDALYVLEQLASVQGTGDGSFQVKAWNVRGDGGTYRDGEKLVVSFYANRDCFVKVYHVDVNGKTQLVFPNRFFRDNAIKAGRIYRIPDASYPFSFDLTAPYGTEFIKAVASTTQFTDIEEAFADMGRVTAALITRGLVVKGKDTQVAEAGFSYTTVK